ncbi:flagellar hook-length control protein FliK [Oscillibacter valericigenes Sjm18-20]|nr:flagellar hook-length control protein FliK [Oscillibacter valericigenes Sjm18-20]
MNTMNELLQVAQLTSAAQTQRTVKADSGQKTGNDSDSGFGKLLKDRVGADGTKKTPEQTKIGTDAKADTAEQSEDPKDETLKEVAAAMTMLMTQVPPVQIQTQEILPEQTQTQTTAVVEMLTSQQSNGQAALQNDVLQAACQSAESLPTGETVVSGQQKTAASQIAQDTGISQTTQAPQAEITVTVQSTGTQSNGSMDEQPDDTGLTGQDGDRETPQPENVDIETAQPLFRDMETVPVKVGETPVADTEQPDMDAQLAKQIGTTLEDGAQQVKLQLSPENLGTLTVDLTHTQDGTLQVVLHTTTEKAANLLSQHAENLGALLQNSTQNTVRVEVQRQEQSQQFQQQSQQQNQQHGQSQQHSRRQQSGDDFLQQLRLGLVTLNEQVS